VKSTKWVHIAVQKQGSIGTIGIIYRLLRSWQVKSGDSDEVLSAQEHAVEDLFDVFDVAQVEFDRVAGALGETKKPLNWVGPRCSR
jgi:hypothetical protein